jgi:hypothetical protein
MLLLEAVLLLFTLIAASSPLDALLNLFGLGDHWIDAPTQFTAGDVAICAVLVAGIIGSVGGRTWGRTTVMATMGLIGYPLATSLLSELRTSDGRHQFTLGHNLVFNLVMVVEFLIAVGTLVAVFATRGRAAAGARPAGPRVGQASMPGAMPGAVPAVMPGQAPGVVPGQAAGQMPMPGPGQAYPQQPAPGFAPQSGHPGQPGPSGYPAQPMPQPMPQPTPGQQVPPQPQPGQPYPGQQPAPGYAPPPVPPQAGPIQQPTPTQEALAYRPTQYSPPPGQPPVNPQGNPPVPPGA